MVEKWPGRMNKYKVRKEDIGINLEEPLAFSLNRKDWINLKEGYIVFKGKTKSESRKNH